ncbi:hypothetical protein OAH46_01155 [Verrucomicrobia bacterium]|nr:hypothetical protein [Verrucomicrobiota bacterium]
MALSSNGHISSQLELANMYSDRYGVFNDIRPDLYKPCKALELYEKSTIDGRKDGYFRIGNIYEKGLCGDQDINLALENYTKGALRYDALCILNLAEFYSVGNISSDLTNKSFDIVGYAWISHLDNIRSRVGEIEIAMVDYYIDRYYDARKRNGKGDLSVSSMKQSKSLLNDLKSGAVSSLGVPLSFFDK